jgi:hypothetical protein
VIWGRCQEYNKDQQFKWEEFSVVELENFLRILEQEEAEAVRLVGVRLPMSW